MSCVGRYRHDSGYQPSAGVRAARKKQTSTGRIGGPATGRLQKDSRIAFRSIFKNEFIRVGCRIHEMRGEGRGDTSGEHFFRLLFG